MYDPLLLPELREMLLENDDRGMKEFCEVLHPGVVAENLEVLTDAEIWRVLGHTESRRMAQIFVFMSLSRQVELVLSADQQRLSALLEAMASDDRRNLLASLDPEKVETLLPLVAQAERAEIRKQLSYPEHSAGAIMTTDYASFTGDLTVREALNQLRLQAPNSETIYYVYVLDEARRLTGFISLRKLILARPDRPVSEVMNQDVISAQVDEDQESVANKMARYDFLAIPVVDDQNRLVGIITHDDVLDVLQQEATEDVHRMGAVGPFEQNYLEASFVTVWWSRAIWLAALFIAEMFTFNAMSHFDDAMRAVTVLGLLVPLCISTGGNSGSQAATLICRALALGHVGVRDWFKVLRHELLMGVVLGLTLGTIAFFRVLLLTPHHVLENPDHTNTSLWYLTLAVSQSVAMICLWGTVVGSMLPLVFRRMGIDPGIASSPFVATFVDVTGIVIYFSMAKMYLL